MTKIKKIALTAAIIFVPGALPFGLAYIFYKKVLANRKKP